MTHRGRVLAVASLLLVVAGLVLFWISWRRSRGWPALEHLWPWPIVSLAIVVMAFVVVVYVARHVIDDDSGWRAQRRRDRFD